MYIILWYRLIAMHAQASNSPLQEPLAAIVLFIMGSVLLTFNNCNGDYFLQGQVYCKARLVPMLHVEKYYMLNVTLKN